MIQATNNASSLKRYPFGSIGFQADMKAAAETMAAETTIPETIGDNWTTEQTRLILAKLEMAVGSILDLVCRAVIVATSVETLVDRVSALSMECQS